MVTEKRFSASFSEGNVAVQTKLSQTTKQVNAEVEDLVFGVAATVSVGKVSEGDTASVTNVGSPHAAVLDFVLPRGPAGEPGTYQIGNGLKLDEATNTLSVDAATEVQEDNTLPITSAAVYETVGNIDALLKTI